MWKWKWKTSCFQVYIKNLSSTNVALFLVLDISQKDCLVLKLIVIINLVPPWCFVQWKITSEIGQLTPEKIGQLTPEKNLNEKLPIHNI